MKVLLTGGTGYLEPETACIAKVRIALSKATDCLVSMQDASGFWCGELEGDSILQSEYILASRKDATRMQRQILAGVTIALVVSIVLGVVAFFQRQEAVRHFCCV